MLHHSHSGAGAGSAKSNWASVKPWTSARYHGPISSQPGNRVRAETVETTDAGIGDLLLGDMFVQEPSGMQESGTPDFSLRLWRLAPLICLACTSESLMIWTMLAPKI